MSDEETEKPAANDGRFKPGNKMWMARTSSGRNPLFHDPESLWNACKEYFDWVDENPLYEEKVFAYQGNITRTQVALARVMTLGALCMFIRMNDQTWREYRAKPDFSGVCDLAEQTIRDQKFAGAASGRFNPMIIARDLGLKESTAVDHSSTDGSMTPTSITRTIVHTDGSVEIIE